MNFISFSFVKRARHFFATLMQIIFAKIFPEFNMTHFQIKTIISISGVPFTFLKSNSSKIVNYYMKSNLIYKQLSVLFLFLFQCLKCDNKII